MADIIEIEAEDDVLEQARRQKRAKEEMLESLAGSIMGKFEKRAGNRTMKENQWLRAAKLYYGKLSIEDYYNRGETPFRGISYKDRPDVNVVRTKCSIAIAQTISMQFGTGNKNWDLWPSRDSTDTQATSAADAMSATIESQLDDTNYSFQCRQAMKDRVIIGTGILKGPSSVGELVRSYTKLEGTETWAPDLTVDYKPTLVRVNPWFFYPDETVEDVKCLGDTIEVHPLSALQLKKLRKHEGFMKDEIEKVLEKEPLDFNAQNWADFALMSENNPNLFKNKYLVLEYRGPITRTQLDLLEIEPSYDALDDEYYGEVWVCQGEVIRAELESIEASFKVPYYMSVWEKDPGSVFGYGVPLMMEDAQRVVNEAWHMILDNSAMSSGPQVAMQKHLIEPANGKWELGPNQIWNLLDPAITVDQAIQFFNVPNVTAQIVPILQMAQAFSEEESQIPLITAGLNSPQNVDTATGQLVTQQASTTLLDFMSEEWDDNMTQPIIAAYYAWNMQYNDDPTIKGQFTVDVRTSTQYKNKQLHIRDLEKLSVEAAQNPEMAAHVDIGQLTRVRLNLMSLPDRTIVKPLDQVMAEKEAAAANQGPDPEILALQLKSRAQDLEEMRLEFEMKQQQQREQWEHEERMTANQARLVEADARVTVSQNEKDVAILQIAAKSEGEAARILSQEGMNRENQQTKAFLAGLEETRKERELFLYEQEIDLAKDKGSGV